MTGPPSEYGVRREAAREGKAGEDRPTRDPWRGESVNSSSTGFGVSAVAVAEAVAATARRAQASSSA